MDIETEMRIFAQLKLVPVVAAIQKEFGVSTPKARMIVYEAAVALNDPR